MKNTFVYSLSFIIVTLTLLRTAKAHARKMLRTHSHVYADYDVIRIRIRFTYSKSSLITIHPNSMQPIAALGKLTDVPKGTWKMMPIVGYG